MRYRIVAAVSFALFVAPPAYAQSAQAWTAIEQGMGLFNSATSTLGGMAAQKRAYDMQEQTLEQQRQALANQPCPAGWHHETALVGNNQQQVCVQDKAKWGDR
jgi:hypothetical protein